MPEVNGAPAGVLKTGYLSKKHGPFNKWVRRYYVLTENSLIRSRRTDRDSYFGQEVARYDLDKISMVEVSTNPGESDMFEFCVKEGGRSDVRSIKASNAEMATSWVKAILLAKKKRARLLRRESTKSPTLPEERSVQRVSITGEFFKRGRQNSIFGPAASFVGNAHL